MPPAHEQGDRTMSNHLLYPSTHDVGALRAAEPSAGKNLYGQPGRPSSAHVDVHGLFLQLGQSLGVLSNACELVVEGRGAAPAGQALRVWLQPHARQAEEAMHRLRDLRLTNAPAVTELSQSLTVLVLAADMLAQGQLSGADALSFYGLLRRNADAAMRSLSELRARLDPVVRV
jgi:hypothetical protein